jgi:hypothetical protein
MILDVVMVSDETRMNSPVVRNVFTKRQVAVDVILLAVRTGDSVLTVLTGDALRLLSEGDG